MQGDAEDAKYASRRTVLFRRAVALACTPQERAGYIELMEHYWREVQMIYRSIGRAQGRL